MKKIKNNEDEVPRPKHNLWPVKMIILTFFIAAVFAFLADLIEKEEFKKKKRGDSKMKPLWQTEVKILEEKKNTPFVYSKEYVDKQLNSINRMLEHRNYSLMNGIIKGQS